jgi:hypothetical protein
VATVTTNTVESSFALLKRGLVGTFPPCWPRSYLQRYVHRRFDFRLEHSAPSSGFSDSDRAAARCAPGTTGAERVLDLSAELDA